MTNPAIWSQNSFNTFVGELKNAGSGNVPEGYENTAKGFL
jgi:hypothetical protein